MHLLAGLVLTLVAVPQPAATATVRGRVYNPDGQAMSGVEIVPFVLRGEREQPVGTARLSAEDGSFELTSLPPGPVFLRAVPRVRRVVSTAGSQPDLRTVLGHPTVYYPGVMQRIEAWPIDLAAGETVELDFHLPPVLVASIRATVSGPADHTIDQFRVMRPASNSVRNARVSEGIALIDGLREGRHVVVARGRDGDRALAAFEILDLESGEARVALRLQPTATVTGRLVADRDAAPPLAGVRVTAAWTRDGEDLDLLPADHGEAASDGSFRIEGLFGRRTFRVSGLPDEWYVYAVRRDSSDITVDGVDLTAGSSIEIGVVIRRR